MIDELREGFADALGQVLAQVRRDFRQAQEVAQAETARLIAELRAEVAATKLELHTIYAARIEQVHDGKDGKDGADGQPGERGADGGQGPKGDIGEKGDPGPQGERGERGEPGEAVTGPAGEQGDPGPPGATGERGLEGPQGERGEPGDTGATGATGAAGERGPQGEQGPAGERGPEGQRGDTGPAGQPGEPGAPGARGEPGQPGPEGPAGPRGDPGPTGRMPGLKPWARGVHYEGSVVTHEGSTWCANCDTAEEPPHNDWTLVAAKGRDAPVGEVRGTYDPEATDYRKFDLVTCNGCEWRAKRDAPGELPGDGWALSAQKGARGRGVPGEPGPPGPAGPAGPTITGWITADYRAIPLLSDGTAGPSLDLRQFFEAYHHETM